MSQNINSQIRTKSKFCNSHSKKLQLCWLGGLLSFYIGFANLALENLHIFYFNREKFLLIGLLTQRDIKKDSNHLL